MIEVTLHERPREFDLFIGQRRVSRIRLYGSRGAWRCEYHENQRDWIGVQRYDSVSAAVQGALCQAGYGRAKGFEMKKISARKR